MKAHIFAEPFADLLWNSYRVYKRTKTDNDFYEKVKIIMDLNILRPHAYRTMNLNRIIDADKEDLRQADITLQCASSDFLSPAEVW